MNVTQIHEAVLDNARAAVELKIVMERPRLCELLLDYAHAAVERKAASERSDLHKAIYREIFLKQFEEVEDELVVALQPMFTKQIRSIASELIKLNVPTDKHQSGRHNQSEKTGDKSLAPVSDQAQDLIEQSFDPREWQEELIDRTLPVMAKKMLEAAHSQLRVMGFDKKSIIAWRNKHLSHNQQSHARGEESEES